MSLVLADCREETLTNLHYPASGEGGVNAMAPQLNVVVRGKRVSCPGVQILLGAVPNIKTDRAEIRLPDERHMEALQAVVRYLADGKMDSVNAHNAEEVLDCARLLGLTAVKDACEKTLVQRVSVMNCVRLRQLATQRCLPRLMRGCDRLLSEAFPAVLTEPAALDLPRIQVRLDVSSQLLEFGTDLLEKVVPQVLRSLDSTRTSRKHLEEAVVQLILLPDFRVSKWTSEARARLLQTPHSPEKHTPDLLSKLRSGCSPARQLILSPKKDTGECRAQGMQVVAMTKLSDTSCVCLVDDQNSLLLVTITLCTLLQNGQFPTSPTTGLPTFSQVSGCFIAQMSLARSGFGAVATESEILAIGGFNRDGCMDSSECYSSITNTWKPVEPMNTRRGRLSITQVEDNIYAIGGSDGRKELSSVETLDMKLCKWRRVQARMPTPRSCLGSANLNGMVYAVGGEHYSLPLRTTEAFDPTTGSWQTLSPMSTPRSGLAVVACIGKVYAIGGKTQSLKCLASVECYDPERNVWSPVSSMRYARRNAAAVAIGDKVMVVGGYGGTVALRSVEIYDPLSDEWTDCPPLCSIRSHASATLYNNQVYVFGGFSGSSFLNTVECFDLKTDQWTSFA